MEFTTKQTDSVKWEVCNDFCHGCLSSNRILTSPQENTELFLYLTGQSQVLSEPDSINISVCWECLALLRKIRRFQIRIQQAQFVLQQSLPQSNNLKIQSLSTLILCTTKVQSHTESQVHVHKHSITPRAGKHVKPSRNQKDDGYIKKEKLEEINLAKKDDGNSKIQTKEKFIEILIGKEEIVKRENLEEDVPVKRKRKYNASPGNARNTINTISKVQTKYDDDCSDIEYGRDDHTDREEIEQEIPFKRKRKLYTKHKKAISTANINDEYEIKIERLDNFSDLEIEVDEITENRETPGNKVTDIVIAKKKKSRPPKRNAGKDAIITKNENVNNNTVDEHYTKVNLSYEDMVQLLKAEKGIKIFKQHWCWLCKTPFVRTIDLKRHKTFTHTNQSEGPHKCLECSTTVATFKELQTHWEADHNVVMKCKWCDHSNRHLFMMRSHILTSHSKVYTCRDCQHQCYSHREFIKHDKNLHRRLVCDHCGRAFWSKDSISRHMQMTHFRPDRCRQCSKKCKSLSDLNEHYRRFHPELIYNQAEMAELAYCVECDKQYPSVFKYRIHLHTALAHRKASAKKERVKYPCQVCGKTFACKYTMDTHYQLLHEGRSKFQCNICNKYLFSTTALQYHMRHVHEKVPKPKTKICDLCGRLFQSNRVLANHRRTHTGERPYACELCPAAFTQPAPLVTHMRKQHNLQDFSYKCIKVKIKTDVTG